MKTFTKFSLLAAFAALLGTGSALADDQQLQTRLAIQRAQMDKNSRTTTVAVYAGNRAVGRDYCKMDQPRTATRFELRSNAHGQQFGVFVPER